MGSWEGKKMSKVRSAIIKDGEESIKIEVEDTSYEFNLRILISSLIIPALIGVGFDREEIDQYITTEKKS